MPARPTGRVALRRKVTLRCKAFECPALPHPSAALLRFGRGFHMNRVYRRVTQTLSFLALLSLNTCAKDSGENAGANFGASGSCPAGQQWNGQACVSMGNCPSGQTFNGQYCVSQVNCPSGYQWNGQTCVGGSLPPSGTGGTSGSGSTPIPSSGERPTAKPADPALSAAAQAVLDARASQVAPGAAPVGDPMVGQFQPGEAIQTTVEMQPGRCYTVVAESLPGGISELNIEMLPQVIIPNLPSPILAQDQSTGSSAVLGAQPNCQKWPLPFSGSMRVVVWAAAGQGVAAARVYAK